MDQYLINRIWFYLWIFLVQRILIAACVLRRCVPQDGGDYRKKKNEMFTKIVFLRSSRSNCIQTVLQIFFHKNVCFYYKKKHLVLRGDRFVLTFIHPLSFNSGYVHFVLCASLEWGKVTSVRLARPPDNTTNSL